MFQAKKVRCMARGSILLSEEINYGYHFVAEELRREGYLVVSTDNSLNLMESIRSVQPDLLIVDVDFYSLKELDIFQMIREEHHDLPVIIWCTDGNPSFHPRIIRADYMVSKSCGISELKNKISLALGDKSNLPSRIPG